MIGLVCLFAVTFVPAAFYGALLSIASPGHHQIGRAPLALAGGATLGVRQFSGRAHEQIVGYQQHAHFYGDFQPHRYSQADYAYEDATVVEPALLAAGDSNG